MILSSLFLAAASISWGQSTGTITQSFDPRIDSIEIGLRELQSGRPTLVSTLTIRGGVCFGDGTCQTTASSTLLTSTQTFSGGNTFTSSVTFVSSITLGSRIYSSSISATSIIVNGESVVVNSSFTSVTAVSIYGFQSSTTYIVHYELYPSAAAELNFNINNNTVNSTFSYINRCMNSAATDVSTNCQACAAAIVQLLGSETKIGGGGISGWFLARAIHSDVSAVADTFAWQGNGMINYYSNTSDLTTCLTGWTSGRLRPVIPATFTFTPSAGNVTGRIWVTQTTMPQVY